MFIKSTKMKLSINKAIKNNFKFFLLAYTLLYFCLINLKIFEDYWDEKIFWEHRAGNWTKKLTNQELLQLKMYKLNKEWVLHLVDEGYTILDMGDFNNMGFSAFYAMEKMVIFK
ncbi:hypothetical protein MSHRCOH1_03730 [Candidatus Ornithobacterium hominis]|nr:hypothetical protein MSHRCOH1_03730 [Candidatus Ornithobacterium hominis]